MGFFSRLVGTPLVVTGSMDRLVVGGEHYPNAYKRLRVGSTVRVALIAEPQNKHDRKSVAVRINGVRAGYIGASTAATLQPMIIAAKRAGYLIEADGVVQADKAIRLDLPWPRELESWLQLPAEQRGQGFAPPLLVSLKRLGDYQDALAQALAGRRDVRVPATLEMSVTERGKYAGQKFIRVAVDGTEIGLIPAQFRHENQAVFAQVEAGVHSGEVYIRRDEDRIWAQLSLR